jgi:hypothetical protein
MIIQNQYKILPHLQFDHNALQSCTVDESGVQLNWQNQDFIPNRLTFEQVQELSELCDIILQHSNVVTQTLADRV